MRRTDRELKRDEALAIVKENNYGILSLVLESGEPYGVPINYGLSQCEGKLIMHAAQMGLKLDAIKHMPKGSFCIVNKSTLDKEELTTYYSSAILSGKITLVEDIDEKRNLLIDFLKHYDITEEMARYDLDNTTKRTAVIVMDIENITGKANKK